MVTSHCVENDFARRRGFILRLSSHVGSVLGFFYLHHLAAVVMAAFGTDTMGHAGLTAVWAKGGLRHTQRIVRAPFVATSLGMSPFRIWHNYSCKIVKW
jgi:hypothetical protein